LMCGQTMDEELRQLQSDLDALMAELVVRVPSHVSLAEYARLRARERAIRQQIAALEQVRSTRDPDR
jgi:hypothetical protein